MVEMPQPIVDNVDGLGTSATGCSMARVVITRMNVHMTRARSIRFVLILI